MNAATAQPFSQSRISPVTTSIPIALRCGSSYKLPPWGRSIQSSTGTGKTSHALRPVAYSEVSSNMLPFPSEYNRKGETCGIMFYINYNAHKIRENIWLSNSYLTRTPVTKTLDHGPRTTDHRVIKNNCLRQSSVVSRPSSVVCRPSSVVRGLWSVV